MTRSSVGVKLISLLLTVGGAAGIGVCVWILAKAHTGFSKEAVLFVVFAVIFGWATWTGVDLWRNKPRAYKWAMILLAFQIPNITIPAFTYQFYTGLLFLLSFRSTGNVGLEFRVASLIAFQTSPDVQDVIVGINVVAVAALICLIHVFPGRTAHSAAAPK